MEYNTQREKLVINDYGRTIYKLVQAVKNIPDRDERTEAAKVVVSAMAQVNPSVTENINFEQTLWDHLMILADYELDVDCPYPLSSQHTLSFKPERLKYRTGKIKYPYYGRSVQNMAEKVRKMEDGEEKRYLTEKILQQMKLSYRVWNNDSVEDSTIIGHLSELSNGELTVEEDYKISQPTILPGELGRPLKTKKRKKKK